VLAIGVRLPCALACRAFHQRRSRHRRTLTVCAGMPRVPPAPVLSSSVRSQLAIVPWSAACAPSRGPPRLASCSLSLYARAPLCARRSCMDRIRWPRVLAAPAHVSCSTPAGRLFSMRASRLGSCHHYAHA
jgi:hypothetical protein